MNAWEREDDDAPMPSEEDLAKLGTLYGVAPLDLRYAALWDPPRRVVRENGVTYVGGELPRELQAMAKRFEAEALERGALEEDMVFIRLWLEDPRTARKYLRGYQRRSQAATREEKADYEAHIDMVRDWLDLQLARRSAK